MDKLLRYARHLKKGDPPGNDLRPARILNPAEIATLELKQRYNRALSLFNDLEPRVNDDPELLPELLGVTALLNDLLHKIGDCTTDEIRNGFKP